MSQPGVEAALVLDCRGQPCPRPIIELGRHIGEVEIGEHLRVEADDPAAAVDVPAWCRMRQQVFVGTSPSRDGVPGYLVRRIS